MGHTSYRDAAYLSLRAMEEHEDSLVGHYMGQNVGMKRHMCHIPMKQGFNTEAVEMASHLKTDEVMQRFMEKDKLGKVMKKEVSQDVARCTSIDLVPSVYYYWMLPVS